jgi:hypothetical protein
MQMDGLVGLLQKAEDTASSNRLTMLPAGADDRGMRLFWVQLGFLILVVCIIALRIFCKAFVVKKISLDDWLMFLAAVSLPSSSPLSPSPQTLNFPQALYLPYGIMAMHGVVAGGTGKTVGTYTAEMAAISLRAWYLCEVLYSPITICIRISICVFLLRIAVEKVHRLILICNIGLISIISIAYFFVMVLQCTPSSYFWEQVLGAKGKCIDPNVVPDATIAHSVISAISDWIVGILPIVILWKVKINRRTKVSIAIVLSMGMV